MKDLPSIRRFVGETWTGRTHPSSRSNDEESEVPLSGPTPFSRPVVELSPTRTLSFVSRTGLREDGGRSPYSVDPSTGGENNQSSRRCKRWDLMLQDPPSPTWNTRMTSRGTLSCATTQVPPHGLFRINKLVLIRVQHIWRFDTRFDPSRISSVLIPSLCLLSGPWFNGTSSIHWDSFNELRRHGTKNVIILSLSLS